jgi:hypothetical protein
MQQFEYRVVPAPQRGEKVRGAKTTAERFAAALMSVMNDLGRDGWEYLRADTLPCEERVGLTGKSSSFLHMLVFRRPLSAAVAESPAVQTSPKLARPMPDDPEPGSAPTRAPLGAASRVTPFVKPGQLPTIGPARDPAAGGD